MGLASCVQPKQTFEKLPPGIWRATLLLDRQPVQKYGDDRDIAKKFDFDSELPFNFEVIYEDDDNFYISIHNAEERIKVSDIVFGLDRSTAKDTVIIDFPVYDTQIRAIYEDGVLEGEWIVFYKENYKIPFKAVHGQPHRFNNDISATELNVAGKWDVKFAVGTPDEYPAIAEFKQENNIVTGTFLTETGDFRFLEGALIGSKLYLSCFDGAHAFLFNGKLMPDGSISGTFRSGSQYTTNWEATLNKDASLQNSFSLTKSRNDEAISFSFPDENGNMVSIHDAGFRDKIKLIQIMGTWCPNCMDETLFLKEYFKENPDTAIAVISIAFERYKDTEKSLAAIMKFKQRLNIEHPVLLGGYYDKSEASLQLPQLDKIISYPTLLFVNRNNKIVKIHTGFSGPATSEYALFKSEFKQILESIDKL
ncbi:MAG: TlpA family protein disulfide reductase [Saprospiraceae bacterium]|nr:TlpA family protein disulfide reductase [Saprospiraceae bacterium]